MTIDEARQAAEREHEPRVTYRAARQGAEEGVITRAGQRYVFVRYGTDVAARATDPYFLTLAGTPEPMITERKVP